MTGAGPVSPREDLDWGQWFDRNGRRVLIGLGVVVLAAAAFWWYRVSTARKEAFASQALDQARASAEAGNLPLAASDLARVVDRFSGTRASDQAAILLAQVRMLQGQVDVAVRGLQQFLNSRHPDYVRASAYSLLGAGLEEQGKNREAGAAYRQASDATRLDFLKAQYLIDASRALANAGDTTGAKAALNQLLKDYGQTEPAAEARVRLGELGGQAPAARAEPTNSR